MSGSCFFLVAFASGLPAMAGVGIGSTLISAPLVWYASWRNSCFAPQKPPALVYQSCSWHGLSVPRGFNERLACAAPVGEPFEATSRAGGGGGIARMALTAASSGSIAACAFIVGYAPDELMALTFQDITHPDDLEADLAYASGAAGEIDKGAMESANWVRTAAWCGST